MSQPDRQAEFAELIANHQSQIYGFVRAMVRLTDDAQDLHQQTLAVLWHKFDQFEAGTNFLAWALRVAELEVRIFRRQRHLVTGLSEDVMSQLAVTFYEASESGALDERKAALTGCLEKLSSEDRSLVNQVYLEQQRINQVAQRLNRLPQSVSNSLRRIRRSLFECIESSVARGVAYDDL